MTEQEWLASDDPREMLSRFAGSGVPSRAANPYQFGGSLSERKLRSWVEACRSLSRLSDYADIQSRSGLNIAVGYWASQDGKPFPMATRAALVREIFGNPFRPVTLPPGPSRRCWSCEGYGTHMGHGPDRGNPTCDACGGEGTLPDPCPWLTPQVLTLAQAAYDERRRKCDACHGTGNGYHVRDDYIYRPTEDFCPPCRGTGTIDDGTLDPFRLALLSDALEEVGCPQEHPLLLHLRGEELYPAASGGDVQAWVKLPLRGPHYRGCWAVDLILGKE